MDVSCGALRQAIVRVQRLLRHGHSAFGCHEMLTCHTTCRGQAVVGILYLALHSKAHHKILQEDEHIGFGDVIDQFIQTCHAPPHRIAVGVLQ